MAKVSLSISDVVDGMTSEEVQQKLAKLYSKPEQHFEKLCQSLFIMQQPFVLLKDIEQEIANKHEKRLTSLGFICSFGDDGLSLVPTAAPENVGTACCPSCEQPCGDEVNCQHCGVFIEKFLKQKAIDEEFQKKLQSASNSHERIQKFQAEQAEKEKAQTKANKTKKQNDTPKTDTDENEAETDEAASDSNDVDDFKAAYKEKRNNALYAVLAAATIVVGGGSYFAYDHVTNRYVSDAPVQLASVEQPSNPPLSEAVKNIASVDSVNSNSAVTEEIVEVIEETLFDQWSDLKRANQTLKNQIHKLVDEDMLASASGLVAGKTDPRLQVYGRQELIKIQGNNEKTDRKMLNAYMLVLALEDAADRVAATLNQSSIYRQFERHDEATKTYDQAARIALGIEDPESRILSETALAEHHVKYGTLEGARSRYQAAKIRTQLLSPEQKTAAIEYIAKSEVSHGLTGDAESTASKIADSDVREKTLLTVADIAERNKVSGVPELAVGKDSAVQQGTGDELIDDLIKMNEENKKKIKAAGALLGQ